VDAEMAKAVRADFPDLVYYPLPRLLVLDRSEPTKTHPGILVVTAGTADLPVAEEAAMTAELMNNAVERLYDVGVAGIHRLLNQVEQLWQARVIIVVAGMDGALPSVVGGLVSVPVVAVPTSVGYGASFQGISALLTMLNSCATGIGVVNIDNGFGAGVLASNINQLGL
jgi:NCAIR mutase (PurE)-related protein